MALFLSFEGGEGCGKSTQARALYRRLQRYGVPVVLTHEPGGTPLGARVRRVLKRVTGTDVSPLAELFLVNASRAQLVRDIIAPNLAGGTAVICDRFTDSTIAYQGYGRAMEMRAVEDVNYLATRGLAPDLTVLMDVPVELGLARKGGGGRDRFESEDVAFHQRVRQGYLELAAGDPGRWLVVDATLPRREIGARVWRRVSELLSR